MKRLDRIRNTVLDAGEEVATHLKAKSTDDISSAEQNLRRAIRKAKSTTGVTLAGREMALAETKLDECMMWANREGWKVATERLQECLMWAAVGISEEKASTRH